MNLPLSLEHGVPVGLTRRTMGDIALEVCTEWDISLADLRGPGRTRRECFPRQHFMALAYEQKHLSLTMIGDFINRDHMTVLHGIGAHRAREDA